jgi:hypothetical protein
MLWPPPFTASSTPFLRANATAFTTSSSVATRATIPGRRSIMAFQIVAASR